MTWGRCSSFFVLNNSDERKEIMDSRIRKLIDALEKIMAGEAARVIAGEDVCFQKIVDGMIFIHVGNENFLLRRVSGEYRLQTIPS